MESDIITILYGMFNLFVGLAIGIGLGYKKGKKRNKNKG